MNLVSCSMAIMLNGGNKLMKLFASTSYKSLLIKSILMTFILNILFTPIVHAPKVFPNININSIVFSIFAGSACLVLSFFWGFYIRKCNQQLLLSDDRKRKRYAIIIAIVSLIGLLLLLIPELTAWWQLLWFRILLVNVDPSQTFLFAFFDQAFSFFTMFSILICLAIVFLFKHKRA